MPSHERTGRFERGWKSLSEVDRDRFRVAFKRFDSDLETGSFRPGLRIKRVEGTDSVFELTWAPDGLRRSSTAHRRAGARTSPGD